MEPPSSPTRDHLRAGRAGIPGVPLRFPAKFMFTPMSASSRSRHMMGLLESKE